MIIMVIIIIIIIIIITYELGDGVHLLLGPDGVEDDWPLAGQDVERNVHAGDRGQDVREQDDAIRLEGPPRLQGDLDGEVGVLRALPEGLVDLAHVLVHLHVPSRLPHHPDWRSLDLLSAKRTQEEGIGRVRRGGGRGLRGRLGGRGFRANMFPRDGRWPVQDDGRLHCSRFFCVDTLLIIR